MKQKLRFGAELTENISSKEILNIGLAPVCDFGAAAIFGVLYFSLKRILITRIVDNCYNNFERDSGGTVGELSRGSLPERERG